jgi:hypothetical protein
MLHRSRRGRLRDRSPAILAECIVGITFANRRTVTCRDWPSTGASQAELAAPGTAEISAKGIARLARIRPSATPISIKSGMPRHGFPSGPRVVTNSCSHATRADFGSLPLTAPKNKQSTDGSYSLQKCLRQLAAARMHKGRVSPPSPFERGHKLLSRLLSSSSSSISQI